MKRRFLAAFCAILCFGTSTQAAFKTQFSSVRAASMGNAFTASADEASSLFTNPAGITRLGRPEATFMYGKPFTGLPGVNIGLGQASFAAPTRHGSIGLGLGMFNASGLLQERTLALSYGRNILRGIQAGLTAKHLYHSYDIGSDPSLADNPLFKNGAAKSAISFDAGVIIPLVQALKLGVAIRNINEPNVGVVTTDRVRREVQAGLVYDLPGLGMKVSGDMLLPALGSTGSFFPNLGLEKIMAQNFALRLGANFNEFTTGFGLTKGSMGFDYAFVLNRNLLQDNMGSHRMSVTYRFGIKNAPAASAASFSTIPPAAQPSAAEPPPAPAAPAIKSPPKKKSAVSAAPAARQPVSSKSLKPKSAASGKKPAAGRKPAAEKPVSRKPAPADWNPAAPRTVTIHGQKVEIQ